MTERLQFHFSLSFIGEANGNPLQCSCLENPRDRGAWWAAVYRVAQSRTRLKRLSSSRNTKVIQTQFPLSSCSGNRGLPLWLSWWRIRLQFGRPGFNPWVGRSPGEGKGYQLQYCGLENSMDCIVHGVAKSQKRLSDFHFHLSFPCGSDGKEWAQLEIEQLTLLSCHWKDIQRVCYLSRAALPSL